MSKNVKKKNAAGAADHQGNQFGRKIPENRHLFVHAGYLSTKTVQPFHVCMIPRELRPKNKQLILGNTIILLGKKIPRVAENHFVSKMSKCLRIKFIC